VYYELLMDEPFDTARPAVESKRRLGRSLAARYHGDAAGDAAEARFDRLHVQHSVPDDIEDAALPDEDPVHLPGLLADAFGVSRSEARRLLSGGGVKIEGEAVGELDVPASRLDGAVVQLGKRRFKRFRRGADNG
jgi:tyrosyl-tRNA synthetase